MRSRIESPKTKTGRLGGVNESGGSMKLRIGTRTSELALTQTRGIAAQLREAHPGLEIEEVHLNTSGDQDRVTPLDAQGGVGLFTKELERALLADECDLAVHSLKDLPTSLPDGLALCAVPERVEPWDVWISDSHPGLVDVPDGGVVRTGSLRRRAQILHRFPQLKVEGIRGNIDTRIAKYSEDGGVGLILAAAGLKRTGRDRFIRHTFGPTELTPAPAQGALGLEIRSDDEQTREWVSVLDHAPSHAAVSAERSFMAAVEAGCHFPIGALARTEGAHLTLLGMLATHDGAQLLQLSVEGEWQGEPGAAAQIGQRLADTFRKSGGQEIIDAMLSGEGE